MVQKYFLMLLVDYPLKCVITLLIKNFRCQITKEFGYIKKKGKQTYKMNLYFDGMTGLKTKYIMSPCC